MKTREQWVEEYTWLVHKVVKNMDQGKYDTEDLISEGMIGLLKAVDRYDDARNVKFATYAAKCIENELHGYFRKAPQKEVLVSFEDDGFPEAEEVISTLKRGEEYRYLYEAVRRLCKKDRMLLDLQYGLTGKACSQQQIAAIFGVSQSTISRREKKILKILRRLMK